MPLRRRRFPGSSDYWEQRYREGGDSGAGSYGETARFKAEVLNRFVREHEILSVIELGCGDGHQLSLADYPDYTGTDVSAAAIDRCRERFAGDDTKRFLLATDAGDTAADLALSLDVLLHLVEDDVYDAYLSELFTRGRQFVGIFGADLDEPSTAPHVRYRKFTEWIAAEQPSWGLVQFVENPVKGADSAADFYFYERR